MYLYNQDKYDYYVIDIEGDSLTPTVIHCAVVESIHIGEVWEFNNKEIGKLREFIIKKNLNAKTRWVGHNIISFDAPWLSSLLDINFTYALLIDTLVLSYVYYPHIPRPAGLPAKYGPHSLAAWGFRFGDFKGDFTDFSKYSQEMMDYCKQDVKVTAKLFRKLTKRMRENGYSDLCCEIEHKIRRIIDVQQNNGAGFNEREATILLASFRSLKLDVEERIHSVFRPELKLKGVYDYRLRKNGTPFASYGRHVANYPVLKFNSTRTRYQVWDYENFNIGSPKQRVERLLSMGWTPTEFTPRTKKGGGGNPKVTEDSLLEFSKSSGIKEVKLISEWMLFDSRISTIEEWLKHLQSDSRIHGRILTCGAGTRRMRHMSPNTGNIVSSSKPYGLEIRALWKTGVGIDAKGLEGRVLLHYLNNDEATKIFMEGDPHQMNADAVTEAVGFEVTRQTAKGLYYAFLYGASDAKLGKMLGHNRKIGKLIRDAIMKNVPGLQQLTEAVQEEYWDNGGWLETIDGGRVFCPSPHAALNYKCQSAGGILMKLATIIADSKIDYTKCMKVLDVHDEVQYELFDDSYAEELGQLYCDAITQAGEELEFTIKMEGDYNVGPTWAETH